MPSPKGYCAIKTVSLQSGYNTSKLIFVLLTGTPASGRGILLTQDSPLTRTKRTTLCFFALATLFASADDATKRPRLVLAIVIDQFRYDYLLRFRQDYNAGFKRMLEQGAVFTDAHYLHAATVTAAGHSTFLSGATPSVSGIIGNEWYDRESKQTVTSVFDCAYRKLSAVRNSFEREKVKAQNHQKFANSDGIRDSPYGHQWRLVA